MKKKVCTVVFLAVTVLSVALRTFVLSSLTDYKTGFILPSSKVTAVIITVVIAAAVLFSSAFSFISVVGGRKGNYFYLMNSLSCFALGVSIGFTLTQSFAGIPPFLKFLCSVLAVLSAVYFVAYALRSVVHYPFSPRLAALPAAFFVFKATCVTIRSAYLAVISDTLFEITAYCLIMLFFLEFARLANSKGSRFSIKKFAGFGTAAAAVSLVFSAPRILLYVVLPDAAHGFSSGDVLLFFAGVYIACEVFTRLLFAQETDEKATLYYVGKH